MMSSMTGFGKSSAEFNGKKITVEIRSLNSKGLDINVKIPAAYRDSEAGIRQLIQECLDRGKIDLAIYMETGLATQPKINKEIADAYFKSFSELALKWNQNPSQIMDAVLKMPDVLSLESEPISPEELSVVYQLTQEACGQVTKFRDEEGQVLKQDILGSVTAIRQLLLAVEPYELGRIDVVRTRLNKALSEAFAEGFDSSRLEQELIFYMDKLDISEEKTRLMSHLNYFEKTAEELRAGKKLGFITQEIGREINTLGSKSNHAEMQKIVVEMKNHLEKIKEQTLNVL